MCFLHLRVICKYDRMEAQLLWINMHFLKEEKSMHTKEYFVLFYWFFLSCIMVISIFVYICQTFSSAECIWQKNLCYWCQPFENDVPSVHILKDVKNLCLSWKEFAICGCHEGHLPAVLALVMAQWNLIPQWESLCVVRDDCCLNSLLIEM